MEKHKELLRRCVVEIRTLRSENQIMSARLEMFDAIMALLHTEIAQKGEAMSPDLTFEIESLLEPLNKA